MLDERIAVVTGQAPSRRTVPETMLLVAERLSAMADLPPVTVDVHAYRPHLGSPGVTLQIASWAAPEDKFPAVAQILTAFDGGEPVAHQYDDNELGCHFSGDANWKGVEISVFACTSPTDACRPATGEAA